MNPCQGLRHFLLALQYFTRIPVTGGLARWMGYQPEWLPRALGHLPGVGALVGLLSGGVLAAMLWLLPSVQMVPATAWVAALLATSAGLLLTGAFHEDGLADLADGLGGSHERERALEIMKDSRIGAFGAIALAMALLGKVALLAAVVQAASVALPAMAGWQPAALLGGAALLGAHACSRMMPILITAWLPHIGDRPSSKSKPIASHVAASTVLVALVWVALILLLLSIALPHLDWWLPLLGALAGGGLVGWRLKVRLQGFTGDGLGAAQQLGELGFYLVLLAGLGRTGAPA
ncbi:adenosylcobinamide-GDP ribazoletransferase [Corticibacter populi]|uniref:Adenosylcobinamide-GDP ribazoletransferase n=1 Tax=Corticibacter populi TaxID=1550736 RepID=A0A3M6R055_9BURK|nr:adenosylcobinamide-GDP ribazoletransferase [Corticibacter populi]RMX08646.1 adenosylcobinamide-GDP ribazoletransferase [Corticibacter populi]RZS35978.1 cobalamin-5'-phosphate synthase [Corticibacter populi]